MHWLTLRMRRRRSIRLRPDSFSHLNAGSLGDPVGYILFDLPPSTRQSKEDVGSASVIQPATSSRWSKSRKQLMSRCPSPMVRRGLPIAVAAADGRAIGVLRMESGALVCIASVDKPDNCCSLRVSECRPPFYYLRKVVRKRRAVAHILHTRMHGSAGRVVGK